METVSVACTTTPDRPAQVVSDLRTHYDNGGFGDAPSMGRATKLEEAAGYDGGTPTYVTKSKTTYDSVGRKTKVEDALGQASTTAYTDTHGLTTGTQTTTPPATPGNASTALTTVQVLDPAWGLPTRTTDANGLHTDLVYDGLGRLTEVWLPNRSKAAGDQKPNYEFGYRVTEGQITAVTTKTLTSGGAQRVAKIELLDGWLRSRQTQAPGPDGRLISDTFYDERGQVVKTYAPTPRPVTRRPPCSASAPPATSRPRPAPSTTGWAARPSRSSPRATGRSPSRNCGAPPTPTAAGTASRSPRLTAAPPPHRSPTPAGS
ncbi:hypothetical protein E1293_40255 [Actinomadura darangshiensis]|uniref:RHS repeat protein n=1 Tax=Actinomadura darangshiensis TaxID=705336 RepID=A0A4R5A760_9ACTN|nr:hypothetical protein [Actinomadura darangshiensis]TDD65432.1 hypothetical protein E1293_40255 [Actinomadura darangshiensis]